MTGTHDISVVLEAGRAARGRSARPAHGDAAHAAGADRGRLAQPAAGRRGVLPGDRLRPGEREDAPLELVTALLEELNRRSLADFDAVFLLQRQGAGAGAGGHGGAVRVRREGWRAAHWHWGEHRAGRVQPHAGRIGLPQQLSVVKHRPGGSARGARSLGEAGGRGERTGGAAGAGGSASPAAAAVPEGHALEVLTEAASGATLLLRPTPKGEQAGAVVLVSMGAGRRRWWSAGVGSGAVVLVDHRSGVERSAHPAGVSCPWCAGGALPGGQALPEREAGVLVGQRRDIKVSELDSRIEVTLPSGLKRIYEGERIQGRQFFGSTDGGDGAVPGGDRGHGEGPLCRVRLSTFVVNIDPGRVRPAPRDPGAPGVAEPARRGSGRGGGQRPRGVELWHLGLGVLILLLLGEALLLHGLLFVRRTHETQMSRFMSLRSINFICSTVLLLSERLDVVSRGYAEFAQIYPQPGWVEHDPEAIWQSVCKKRCRRPCRAAAIGPRFIAAIGITNRQRETTVCIGPDNPAAAQRRLVAGPFSCLPLHRVTPGRTPRFGETVLKARMLEPYLSGTKIECLLRRVPGLKSRAEAGQAIQHDLRFTGCRAARRGSPIPRMPRERYMTSRSDAGIPSCVRCSGLQTESVPRLAACRDFPTGFRSQGSPGDQQSALLANSARPARPKCTFRTGAFLLLNTGDRVVPSKDGMLTRWRGNVQWSRSRQISLCTRGSAVRVPLVQWLRDGLGSSSRPVKSKRWLIGSDSGGVVAVPALAGLGAPTADRRLAACCGASPEVPDAARLRGRRSKRLPCKTAAIC